MISAQLLLAWNLVSSGILLSSWLFLALSASDFLKAFRLLKTLVSRSDEIMNVYFYFISAASIKFNARNLSSNDATKKHCFNLWLAKNFLFTTCNFIIHMIFLFKVLLSLSSTLINFIWAFWWDLNLQFIFPSLTLLYRIFYFKQ